MSIRLDRVAAVAVGLVARGCALRASSRRGGGVVSFGGRGKRVLATFPLDKLALDKLPLDRVALDRVALDNLASDNFAWDNFGAAELRLTELAIALVLEDPGLDLTGLADRV